MKQIHLIDQIVGLEKEMFLAVKTDGPCNCQADVAGFDFHRRVQFASWDEASLQSYLRHLEDSRNKGINLMTIKYARMENLIPPWSDNPLIPVLARQMTAWQREAQQKHPRLMSRARPIEADEADFRSFLTYTLGELETYSDETLQNLHAHHLRCIAKGINLSEVSYEYMAHTLGFESIDEMEEKL
jgi:hypothetical protein